MARFYVYELVDPRCGSVFYIGKGQGLRAWQHMREAKKGRGNNHRKLARINEIVGCGLQPSVHKVAEYDEEADAFEHEAEAIAAASGLTNILAHGGGWSITAEEAARRLEQRKCRIRAKRLASSTEWLRRWLSIAETWPSVTFPGLRDGDAKAAEFLTIVRGLVASPAH